MVRSPASNFALIYVVFSLVTVLPPLFLQWLAPSTGWPLLMLGSALFAAATVRWSFRARPVWTGHLDWRTDAIVVATAAALSVTVFGFAFGLHDEKLAGKFVHDVFAGWVASVAFSSTVGVVVALVSLTNPKDDGFEARATILFQGKTGKHVEYIIDKLRHTFEHYAESVDYEYIIKDYDRNENKFLVEAICRTVVKSYITDVTTTFRSPFEIVDAATPPPGKPANHLLYLSIGGRPLTVRGFANNCIREQIETKIENDGHCLIESRVEYWLGGNTDPNTWSPSRFTMRIDARLRNCIPQQSVLAVSTLKHDLERPQQQQLGPGAQIVIASERDLAPLASPQAVPTYDFRLSLT